MDNNDKAGQSSRKSSAPTRKESKEHKNPIRLVIFVFVGSLRIEYLKESVMILVFYRAFEVGAQRPSPGSIGKLRISSEMRHKLEMVTANHSVRSTSKPEKPSLSQVPMGPMPKKLEDNRRLLLEQQLGMLFKKYCVNEEIKQRINYFYVNSWKMG